LKKIIIELVITFIANITGATIWFFIGGLIIPNLSTIKVTYPVLIFCYAIPIGLIVTALFYLFIYIYKKMVG